MGIIIEDGSGSGRSARVNGENRLLTSSVSASIEHHINHSEGNAFNAMFAVTPAGANDVIFYLKNQDEKDIVIEGVWWQTASAEQVYYKLGVTGTAGGGSSETIIPANLNAGSAKTADVICLSRTADAAVDITGTTGGTIIQKLWLTSAASVDFNANQDIIVPKNQTFTIFCVAGSIALRGTIVFNFHAKDTA